jgi:tetratricopeptide (TPR) repeat protein
MPLTHSPRQRELRVFISSTFRDMQEEREELVKQIFPQLRRLCESRGVTWGEVDLRWGVTDEARSEGRVLPLCLAEIERCRPYFIGLLGERYGWVPEEIPPDLLEAQPWLSEHLEQSVTALEILHGVLRDSQMADHAFFYFRNPGYSAARAGFTEEDPARRERLAALKHDIRKSGLPVAENFDSPRQLGEWVLGDLTRVIDELYPESSIPDPLDRAAADQEAYAASRRRVYIGRTAYIASLDAHAAGDGPPIVVLGESGGGKSALLANWTWHWREQHPGTPVIVHFIGAVPDSADWVVMLRRLLGEFQRRCGIRIEIPDQQDALRVAFANALHMVAARGRVVLVLDALNQLKDCDGAPDLVWLPSGIPANVRLILSTLPGRPLRDLERRRWPQLQVEPLDVAERESLIDAYLQQYAKQLGPERRRRIAAAPQSANGLYLTTLLNELRLFGRHEELDQRIGEYLQAATPFELYGQVIQRWEQDYGKPDPACGNVVRESLVRLWAARRGLSEAELLESLSISRDLPLPRALWSPFFLAASDALVNRGGLLTFAHEYLREAVQRAYVPTVDEQQSAHAALAASFQEGPQSLRQIDELPWQWQEADYPDLLADLLMSTEFVTALWERDPFEVRAYWTWIEAHSSLRMEDVYARVIVEPQEFGSFASHVGGLLSGAGRHEHAYLIGKALAEHYSEQGDYEKLPGALHNLGVSLYALGELSGAMAMHKEEELLCRESGNKPVLQHALGAQGTILQTRGDLDGAMALYQESERLSRELGDMAGLQGSLGRQGLVLEHRGDLEGAMALYQRSERLCRELGDRDGLQASLTNQSRVLYARGDFDGAMELLQESERLCRETGIQHGLQCALDNQAMVRTARGEVDHPAAVHEEEERECRERGDQAGLQAALAKQAALLFARGDYDRAMAPLTESERLSRLLGDKAGLQSSLGKQALILQSRGDLDGALALHSEEERLCREIDDKDGLQRSLGNQAVILQMRGDLDRALALHEQKEVLCRQLGNTDGLLRSLANQAVLLSGLPGRRGGARHLVDVALTLARRDGFQQLVPAIERIRDSIPGGEE